MNYTKIFNLFILSQLLCFNVYSQDVYAIIKKTLKTEIVKENKLIIISSSGCGYCQIALREIKLFSDELDIIVIEYGDKVKRNELKLKYNYTFLDGKELTELGSQDFFPKFFLYNKYDKLIWKKEGWFNKNIIKIKSKIKNH